MKSPLLGYLGSVFVLIAALLMFVSGRYITGGVLLFAAIAGLVIKILLNRKS